MKRDVKRTHENGKGEEGGRADENENKRDN